MVHHYFTPQQHNKESINFDLILLCFEFLEMITLYRSSNQQINHYLCKRLNYLWFLKNICKKLACNRFVTHASCNILLQINQFSQNQLLCVFLMGNQVFKWLVPLKIKNANFHTRFLQFLTQITYEQRRHIFKSSWNV